jgi:hypothetical protein
MAFVHRDAAGLVLGGGGGGGGDGGGGGVVDLQPHVILVTPRLGPAVHGSVGGNAVLLQSPLTIPALKIVEASAVAPARTTVQASSGRLEIHNMSQHAITNTPQPPPPPPPPPLPLCFRSVPEARGLVRLDITAYPGKGADPEQLARVLDRHALVLHADAQLQAATACMFLQQYDTAEKHYTRALSMGFNGAGPEVGKKKGERNAMIFSPVSRWRCFSVQSLLGMYGLGLCLGAQSKLRR